MKRMCAWCAVFVSSACGDAVFELGEGEQTGGEAFAQLSRSARVTLEGGLELNGVDFDDGTYRREAFVTDTASERRFKLRADERVLDGLRSGSTVRVSGALSADEVQVAGEGDVTTVGGGETAAALAVRSTLVMRVAFSDGEVGCSAAGIDSLMFSGTKSVNGWYDEHSFGAMGFGGQVVDVRISSAGAGSCDYNAWASAADAEAQRAGLTLGNFNHRVYVLPSSAGCSWAGLGNLSCGSSCRSWVKNCNLPDVYAHELGHNLGLHHAQSGTIEGTVTSEYGDRSCLMGIGGVGYRHANAPHKLNMGWLSNAQVTTAQGSVRLAPTETAPGSAGAPQVLKLPKADQPGVEYHVSYRRALGSYSTNLSSSYAERVSIHRQPTGSRHSLLIATLGDGETWSDPVNGISINLASHDAQAATVNVNSVCVRNAPQVVLSGNPASQPGGSGNFTVTVSNRDAPGCSASTFALTASAPGGFGATLGGVSLMLNAGQSGTTTLAVTAPDGTADGAYDVTVSADDALEAGHTAAGTGRYLVDATPPATVTTLAGSVSKTRVTLTWAVPSDGSGSGASRYHVLRNGTEIGVSTSTSYVETGAAIGTWLYSVAAEDRAGNVAAAGNAVSVTVRRNGKR